MRRRAALTALGTTAFASAFFAACDEESTLPPPASTELSDVVFDMEGGDEALTAVLAASVVDDPSSEPVLEAPLAGAILTAPFTFEWSPGPTGALAPHSRRATTARRDRKHPLERLTSLLGVRSAHAHGPPVNGRVYFLVLSTADDGKLLRVFTQATSYTPDDAAAAKIQAATGPITAKLLAAELETNAVIQGGGPWASEPVTFSGG